MAGIFGLFDFTKEGPGVPKDAPPKPRFLLFFDIYTRKFWNLMKANIMFFFFNLPALAVCLFLPHIFFGDLYPDDKNVDVMLKFIFSLIIVCVPLLTVGPAQAGFTLILRNYAREEHAFLWSDFKEYALKNFRQSTFVSLIDFLFVVLIANAFSYYFRYSNEGFMTLLGRVFITFGFLIYLMMHLYIYPMMITFKLSLRQLYKNAFIFSVIKFFPNLLIILTCFVFIVLTFVWANIGLLLLVLMTFSTTGFLINFYVYPIIKKYMIDPVGKDKKDAHPETEELLPEGEGQGQGQEE